MKNFITATYLCAIVACTPQDIVKTTSAAKQIIVAGQLVCAVKSATAAMASMEGYPILSNTLSSGDAERVCGYLKAIPSTLPQDAADVLATVPWAVRQDASERLGIMSIAGSRRVISTEGLRKFDFGDGVVIYTNNPNSVQYFGWNTGSSSGSVSNLDVNGNPTR